MIRPLSPTKQRSNTKAIYGFDIETYDKNKKFYCASVYGDDDKQTFFTKKDTINYFKNRCFKNSFVAATNLQFDFMGTFFGDDEVEKFGMQWRGSDLIYCKTYIHDGEFSRYHKSKSDKTITFIDTMNYAHLSVKQIGQILNIKKIDSPKFIGHKPTTQRQKDIMVKYNMRDSEISQKFIKFIFAAFEDIGASPKLTIASSSMSLFKNKYLNAAYFRHEIDDLLNQFNAYYGGRVECFKRGAIKDLNYYDFNSLYPSVMLNEFPDPNTLRVNRQNVVSYIENYDGVAEVEIYCPPNILPLIPYRSDEKLLFPQGTFRGWYSNIELRKALELGYVIKKIFYNYYFKKNCLPFYRFVLDLYDKRLELKKLGSPMEYVVKILMNSLYGKFGQKFIDRDNWIPMPDSIEELLKYDDFERFGNFIRVKENITTPRAFCIPIWALYVSAYGRLKLYEVLARSDPVYCDTDSIITKKEYFDRTEIGKLKKEHFIKKGIIVKPKFYAFIDENNKGHVKTKGLGIRLNYGDFINFLKKPEITYPKFMKFKESLRRNFIPNEIQDITKMWSLEDDKRLWTEKFNPDTLQISTPRVIEIEKLKKIVPLLPIR